MEEYDSQNMMRLISGDRKLVQMIPLELTAAVAAASVSTNGHSSAKGLSTTPSLTHLHHPRSSVIVHESATNESNSNFDEAELEDDEEEEEEDGPFDEEEAFNDSAEYEAMSSPKRLKIDLSASNNNNNSSSSGGALHQSSLDAEDSGRSLDGLSMASSVCSSLETENTHSSCTSLSQAGGKKRKQSNPKKVVASSSSSETKTAEDEEGNDVACSGEGDEGEVEEQNETEEVTAGGDDAKVAA